MQKMTGNKNVHDHAGRNAENPSGSKEIMCADILVGRDAFLQCIAARDTSNYDIKRKHGTRIVDWLHWENQISTDVSVYVHG